MHRSTLAASVFGFIIALAPASLLAQDFWTPTSMTDVPKARMNHTVVWTGQEMIAWGGAVWDWGYVKTGGKYDPVSDTWISTSVAGAPAQRGGHRAVWTGSEMIVWGGYDGSDHVNSGGRYRPQDDTWSAMSTVGAPTGKGGEFTAVWTGKELIVWGGYVDIDSGMCGVSATDTTNTGGRYDPATDTWKPTTTEGAPSARNGHAAVWTGKEMIVWGGVDGTAIRMPNGYSYSHNPLYSGARYDPETDSWAPISSVGAPHGRAAESFVWTGTELIVWGSSVGDNYGGRYSLQEDAWKPIPVDFLSSRYGQSAVWTGSEMIIWGGSHSAYESDGVRYSPETDTWTATRMEGAPSGGPGHPAIWTGSSMIVWGGGYSDTGAVYAFDGSSPVAGRVSPQVDRGSVSATWTGFGDPESGVAIYEWAIGTSPGATDVLGFTDVGSQTNASVPGHFEPGSTYYVTVRATNRAGASTAATSDGAYVTASTTPHAARCNAAAHDPSSGSRLAALAMVLLLAFAALRKRA